MATREAMGTNVEPGLIQRISQGISYVITGVGPDNFFGPSQPLQPVAQDRSERSFDYPVGVNYRVTPRNTELLPFQAMRNLADGYDLMRVVIETRKDQIKSFDWEIIPVDGTAAANKYNEQIKFVSDFFQMPDKEHAWDDWLSMLIEDLLVIDTVCVCPRASRGGKLYSLELIDGATITRKIDVTGRTPVPPDVAYQQIIHGIMANDLTKDQLVYMMRNPRTNRLYGFSPVEQIIMTVNIALRRQISQLEFYTAGNVPEAIAQVPDSWTPKQIIEFQSLWDSMNEGNTAQRRKMRFVPNLKDITFPKKDVLKDEYDEWLARIVCFAFSISPTAFVKSMNRASAEQQADTAKEEGLRPLMKWLENKVNFLIATQLKMPDVKFKWKMENALNALDQSRVDQIDITSRIVTPDEVRERRGLPKLTEDQKAAAWPAPPASSPAAVMAEGTPQGEVAQKMDFGAQKYPINVTVNPPEIYLGDTFVRVNGDSVRVKK